MTRASSSATYTPILSRDSLLGFPDGYRAVFLIGLGYPADQALRPLTRPNRRPFDQVVHWHRW